MKHLLVSITAVLTLVPASSASEPPGLLSNRPSCCVKDTGAGAPLTDRSLYQLESSWTNDAGAALQLAALRGRPQLITMFFASCEYACPILVHDMKRIAAALPASLGTNVGYTLVSFDSERDKPAALARFRSHHQLAAGWTLLQGAPDDVLELAALLGVKFKKDVRGQFAHSNIITVLDANGEIVFQQVGLNRDPAPVVAALKKCLENK